MNIYYEKQSFNQTKVNPFNNLPYTGDWIMFKLLDTADFKQFTGGGKNGIFQVVITKENIDWEYRICDFIQYESSHNKNIILSVDEKDWETAKFIYGNHIYTDNFLRLHEQKVLVHTTSKENYTAIVRDGYLKSWNLLKKLSVLTEDKPIGQLLGDPPDYSDYIMFTSGGIYVEAVVSSRQKHKIETDIDISYIAGARFYFDAVKIAEDGLLVRDGIHLKVKDSLIIDKYILWIATPDILGIPENTTPRIFAEMADTMFEQKYYKQNNYIP